MKRSMNFLFLLSIVFFFMVFFVTSCNSLTLSKDEAKQIINEKHSRDVHWTLIDASPGGQFGVFQTPACNLKMQALITNGFVGPVGTHSSSGNRWYAPTAKGAPYIENMMVWDVRDRTYYQLKVQLSRFVLQDITEILVDKQNGTAIVKYAMIPKPIEPFYTLLCEKKECYECSNLLSTAPSSLQILLKNYDKGWRVIQ